MQTVPFPLNITNPKFGAHAVGEISPDSESIVIIKFTKPDGSKGLTAVLIPAYVHSNFAFEADHTVYPILIPGCEIDITFQFHANTREGLNTTQADIKVRSNFESPRSRLHGL